jgi:hypothetical protein
MKIKAKDLRKTILLGGMSVDEAAEWCVRSLGLTDFFRKGWFCDLLRFLIARENRGDLEVIYDLEYDYHQSTLSIEGDGMSHFGAQYKWIWHTSRGRNRSDKYRGPADAENAARDDCEVLNKFLEDFYG